MKDEEINRKVAEALRWTFRMNYEGTGEEWHDGEGSPNLLPNYCSDLNACAEFEKTLSANQRVYFRLFLSENSDGPDPEFATVEAAMCHATARQRCLAFLKVMEETK